MVAEPETTDDAMPDYTVGDELRMRREAIGKGIADVVDSVRIQARYIEALENNRLEDLPGTVYAIGFVRTYAEYLGLDGAEAVARYKEETQGLKSQSYVMPEPLEEGKVPTAAILLVAVVLAAAAYGVWYYLSQPGGRFAQQVPEVPEHLATVTEVPAPPVLPPSPSPDEAAPALAPTVATPAPTQDMAAAPAEVPAPAAAPTTAPVPPAAPPVPVEREATQTAPSPTPMPAETTAEAPADASAMAPVATSEPPSPLPARDVAVAPPSAAANEALSAPTEPTGEEPSVAPPQSEVPADVVTAVPEVPVIEEEIREPRVYGLDNAAARVVITAQEDAWLEVTDSDDARLFSRVLRKGDSYRAPDREGVKFVTGNAGGLRITVDGQPVPALGPPGQVRRDVKLDPDLLLAGRAWP